MAGATFDRLKNWNKEILSNEDLNAEIDNILNNLNPQGIASGSSSVAEMKLTTDPGEPGSESLATSLMGELQRLRFAVQEIKGTAQWYQSSNTSLSEIANTIGGRLTENRITAGASSTISSQPLFLQASGTNDSVKILGTTTALTYSINGVTYTISSDVTISSLISAPATNNTLLVNASNWAGDLATKFAGEYLTVIPYDTAGTEITSRDGKLCAFKAFNGSQTEYFIARIDNANSKLIEAYRGYFFDQNRVKIPRIALSDNNTITLQNLVWIYATTTGGGAVGYTEPVISPIEPTSPSANDYWFDTKVQQWKRFDSSNFVLADATLVGMAVVNESDVCVAARGLDFVRDHSPTNSVKLLWVSNSQVKASARRNTVKVYGATVSFVQDDVVWDMATNRESGVTEAASTPYYFYLTETGEPKISDIAPYDRRGDLLGWYHPYETWRYLGKCNNDSSSNLTSISLRNAPENETGYRTRIITTTGKYDFVPGMTKAEITLVGGGGGGGGVDGQGSSNSSAGCGGASGGGVIADITSSFNVIETVTVGAGGGGGGSVNNGNPGGDTSFGASFLASGGLGGPTDTQGGTAPGPGPGTAVGGAATGGRINVSGAFGEAGHRAPTSSRSKGGGGGDAPFGLGFGGYGDVANNGVVNGETPVSGYGAGGGGAASANTSTNASGGNGLPGVIIIKESYG